MRINVYIMIYVINILFLYFQNFYNCIEKLKSFSTRNRNKPFIWWWNKNLPKKEIQKLDIMNWI